MLLVVALCGLALGAGAAPVVGELTVKSVGDSYAEIEVPITDLGDDATSASVTLNYGEDAASLDKTYTPATNITEEGTATLTLRKLLPGYTYSVTSTVTNDKDESATTASVSLTTMKSADASPLPGLYQTYFKSAHKAWTKDYTSYAEGTNWLDYENGVYRRELGAIMAYFNTGDGCPRYVSELWGDQVYWPGSGGQWAYWGYMYFDAGKSYKLRCYMMDTFRIVVTHPTTGEQAFCFYGDDYKNPFTSSTFAPPVTGWYPIELRFSNGSGRAGGSKHDSTGAKYVENLGWSSDDGLTWNFLIDSGDGSLLRTDNELALTASERVAGGKLNLDLVFAEATSNRTLAVVWGATRGGESTNGWANAQVIGTVAAGATTATYEMPATWGDDDCLVARFCFVPSETFQSEWSNTIYWHDLTAPALADVAVDGSGGDTIRVTGKVKSFAGDSCALKVLVGTSKDALAEWSGAATTLAAAGDFSFALCETDTAAARYITPGTTYYVCVEATADGKTARSETAEVKTSAAAKWTTASASVSRNVVTFKGRLDPVGMSPNGAAQVTLWAGTATTSLEQVGEAFAVTNTMLFAFTNAFDKCTTYWWQLRATNASAGGTSNVVVSSAIQSVAMVDVTTYTWKKDVAEGAWEDAANWEAPSPNLGYPQNSVATARFAEGTKATVTLSRALTCKTLVVTDANVDATIKKASSGSLSIATPFALSGAGSVLTLSGLTLKITSGNTTSMGAGFALALTNGATLDADPSGTYLTLSNAGGTLRAGSGSTARLCYYSMSGGATTILSNATLTAYKILWNGKGDSADTIRFEGTNSLVQWAGNFADRRFCPNTAGARINLDFVISRNGYAYAPLQGGATAVAMGAGGQSGTASVNLALSDGKVALWEGQTCVPLVSWTGTGGVNTNYVKVAESTLPNKKSHFVFDAGSASVSTIGADINVNKGLMLIVY